MTVTTVSQLPAADKSHSVASVAYDLCQQILALTRAGEFNGQQAARTVLSYFSNYVDPDNPGSMYVDPEMITQNAIISATGLSRSGVSNAFLWLEHRGLITVERNHKRTISVGIALGDAE